MKIDKIIKRKRFQKNKQKKRKHKIVSLHNFEGMIPFGEFPKIIILIKCIRLHSCCISICFASEKKPLI